MKFLVGNKCDLENKRAVSNEQGREFAKQYNIQFFETSAKQSTNIETLFSTCTKVFVDNQKNINVKKEKTINKSAVNLKNESSNSENKKSGCC